tara:strand:- start:7467 stop:8639 length:1173 start_codon:yes stop_codon:yes gene_type:complete
VQNQDFLSAHDPVEQLARLQKLCRLRSIAVYRETALYLQILREEVEPAVRQALFQLISESDPLRFSRMPESQRQRFHAAVQQLTQRCSVLLTVEQQMHLAGQMQREHRRRKARASRQMLQGLQDAADQTIPTADQPPQPAPPQPGSVELSLRPPLDQPQKFGYKPSKADPSETIAASTTSQPSPSPDISDINEADQPDLDVLRSLFELAGEALQHQNDPAHGTSADVTMASSAEPDDHLLPTMPDALLQWMDGMDLALSRRLRNLSHAVNVQMLRSGLAQALLPVNLLEAVINGQMETQAAPSNLLRLRLPIPMGELDQGMDLLCVLLRFSELEFDSHRLRRCRRRLRDQQRELITMVRQQRHWERRCLDREALTPWQSSSDPSSLTSED